MPRLAFFTSSQSKVLDFLLIGQNLHDVLVVDFSTNAALRPVTSTSTAAYTKYRNWTDLANELQDTDLIISYKLPHIVPENIIGIPRYGAFNIHPSLLPLYRGLNPWYALYYDGELNTGVTIHRMSPRADEGEIIMQRRLTLEPGEPLPLALLKSESIAADLIRNFLKNSCYLNQGKPQPTISEPNIYRVIDSIRQLPTGRMWHLFRGFPELLKKVFNELPHKYYEVGSYIEDGKNRRVKISDDYNYIETNGGLISLIDFSTKPTADDYITTINNGDIELGKSDVIEFERDRYGNLKYLQGTEAIVFFAKISGQKKIIRFRKDLTIGGGEDYSRQMKNIKGLIEKENLYYYVKFNVMPAAASTSKGRFPAVVMDYIPGDKLSCYILDNIRKPEKLNELAHKFERICEINNSRGIVHGDLNDSNLIVDNNGNITILDIDNVWKADFPEQRDCGADMRFQHPLRRYNEKMESYLDYFSQIIIRANIKIAVEIPDIYLKYRTNGNIFSEADYINPQSSELLMQIRHHRKLAHVYKYIIDALEAKELSSIIPFTEIVN